MMRLGLGRGLNFRCRPWKRGPFYETNPWELITPVASRTMAVNDTVVPANNTLGKTIGNPIYIPPGATQAHFKLTYSEVATTTAYAYLVHKTNDATAHNGFDGVSDITLPTGYQVWRPGDDQELWCTVQIDVPSSTDGHYFQVNVKGKGWQETIGVRIQVQTGAVNELPAQMPYHRPPRQMVLNGAVPTTVLDIPSMEITDTGFAGNAASGIGVWRSHPSHGYTQYNSNGEIGPYTGDVSHPNDALLPHQKLIDSHGRNVLRMTARRMPYTLRYGSTDFPLQATMIQAQKMPEWTHRSGIWEADIVLPSRFGAWSAFWSLGQSPAGETRDEQEVDAFEAFMGANNNPYNQYTLSSAQHAGPIGSSPTNSTGAPYDLDLLGFDTSVNLWTQINRISMYVDDQFTYTFFNGVEVWCHRTMTLPNDGSAFKRIPLLNIAAKPVLAGGAPDFNAPFNDGSGSLDLYGMRYYPLGVITLEDYTAAKPYPNGKITPDPAFPTDVWNKTPNIALHLSTTQAETIKATGEDAKTWISLDTSSNTAHQSDVAKQPRWGSHTINGVPALKFSEANSDHMQLVAPIDTSNGVTAVFVFRKESGSVNRPLLGGSATGSLTLRVNSSGRLEVVRTGEAVLLAGTTFINTTTDYLVAFRVSDTKIQIYINGTLEAETDDDPALTAPSEFIGKAGSSFYFDGPIGYAHVNQGHLSDADLDAVAGVAATEFGLVWNDLTAGPSAPSAFAVGDWSLDDPGTDGDLDVVISSLPADGGATITDIEFRIDGGTWQSSGGIVDFGITGLNNGQFYSVEIRAVNSVGSGLASDTKTQDPSAPATGDYSMAVVNINSGQYYGFTTNGPQGSITPATASSGDVISNILVSTTGAILMKFGSGVQPNGASTIDLEFADLATTVTLNWVSGNSRYELSGQTAIRTYLEGQAGNSIPLNVNGIPTGSTSPFTTGFDAGFGT